MYAGLRSGRHAGTGRSFGPVAEAADVGDAAAAHGEDLPAPGRPAFLASGRRAGDLQPHQKRPGPAVTSVTTARAPTARALAHQAMT